MIFNGVEMRGLELGDAAALAEAFARNRTYMRAYEPVRPEVYFTEAGQRDRIEGMLADRDGGRLLPWLLVDTAGGEVVGAINLGSIALGPLCSGGVGYWVDTAWHGKGLASAALAEVLRVAREEVGLHRVEAGTLIDNTASQRVLQKAGFEEYGLAPRYLHVNGAWRDHRLFQRLLHDEPPGA
ncbi:GNAT family N-acetyltransferase [Streptomyces sp. NPDC059385]|uniref:GNAT family N-acetyltransferase n=1 Tax=Streptomyces sp. NPDC059385 TaxID=3346817 RepID=UPI0036913AB6